jgi:hypothetical protein
MAIWWAPGILWLYAKARYVGLCNKKANPQGLAENAIEKINTYV